MIEPVGFYENNGLLKVSRSVFSALTPTDKAAFILHEGIYKMARNTSDKKDSASSRQLVAALFSKNAMPEQISQLLKNVFFQNGFLSPNVQSPIVLNKPQTKYTLSFKNASSVYAVSVGLGCLNSGPKYIDTIRITSEIGSTQFTDTNVQNPCQSLFIMAGYEIGPFDKGAVIGDYEIFDDQGKLLASGSIKQYGSRWWALPILRNYMDLPVFPNP